MLKYIRRQIAKYTCRRLEKFVKTVNFSKLGFPTDFDKHEVIYCTDWCFDPPNYNGQGELPKLYNIPNNFTGVMVYRYGKRGWISIEYYKDGKIHRNKYPAIIGMNLEQNGLDWFATAGEFSWWNNGQRHNLNGPASMRIIKYLGFPPRSRLQRTVIGNHEVDYYIYGKEYNSLVEFTTWAKNSGIDSDNLSEEDEILIRMRWST